MTKHLTTTQRANTTQALRNTVATIEAEGLGDDPFAHGDGSRWWNEGVRVLHGRFPR